MQWETEEHGGKWAEEKRQVLFLPIFQSTQGNVNVAM